MFDPYRVRGSGPLEGPESVPVERLDPLLAVATHCTVHNTLATTLEVSITLADARSA